MADAPGATPERRSLVRMRPLTSMRSEEHTSELQSPCNLVCRLLLEKIQQRLDRQLELLLHLVHRLAAQIGHPGMHSPDGLRHPELAPPQLHPVVDASPRHDARPPRA